MNAKERAIGLPFAIAMVDEDGAASSAVPGFYIPPAIADDITLAKIDIELPSGLEQQPGLGLTAATTRVIIVRANSNVVQFQETL